MNELWRTCCSTAHFHRARRKSSLLGTKQTLQSLFYLAVLIWCEQRHREKLKGKKTADQTHHLGQTRTLVLQAQLASTLVKQRVRNNVNTDSLPVINLAMAIHSSANCFQTRVMTKKNAISIQMTRSILLKYCLAS